MIFSINQGSEDIGVYLSQLDYFLKQHSDVLDRDKIKHLINEVRQLAAPRAMRPYPLDKEGLGERLRDMDQEARAAEAHRDLITAKMITYEMARVAQAAGIGKISRK